MHGKKIQEDNSSTPVAEESKNLKDMIKTNKKGYKIEKVEIDDSFPDYVRYNKELLKDWII